MRMTDLTRPASPLGEEQVSQEVAEANLAKDLAEQLARAFSANLDALVYLPRDLANGIVADALDLFEQQHPGLICRIRRSTAGTKRETPLFITWY